jgi:xanthine dehydrogenase accessory factor
MPEQPTTTTHGGLRGLVARLDALHAEGEDALLGLVIATEGSTYQKPGALVLLDRNGLRHGVISGGCLEPELETRAAAVFARGRAALTEFDTRSDEDLVFGSGTGCRGRVRLLLLPQPVGAPFAQALRACVDEACALDVSVAIDGDTTGRGQARLRVAPNRPTPAWWWRDDGNACDPSAAERSPAELPRHAHTTAARALLRIAAPPRLLLLGAGPETPPLLDACARLGWSALVVEHRGRWAAFARSASAHFHLDAAPEAAFARIGDWRCDAAIVMSHHFALDAQYLRHCAQRNVGYVGLLGPPARRDALLTELGAAADPLRARLHAPVGLDLGGSGPEAIALAIAAQLQQYFARRDA